MGVNGDARIDTKRFKPGDPVTVRWYDPGEPYRPIGEVVRATQEDYERLRAMDDGGGSWWCPVHWEGTPGTFGSRRLERVEDLRPDPRPAPAEGSVESTA